MSRNLEQGSQEWLEARAACSATASEVGAVLGVSKYKTRHQYMRQKVRERAGMEPEFTGNAATRWGQEHEDIARQEACAEYDVDIHSTGFWVHPEHQWLGASPDGISPDGKALMEIKCPYSQKLFDVEDRPDYLAQAQVQMACTGAEQTLFVVWTPENMRIVTLEFDPEFWASALEKLQAFHDELETIMASQTKQEPYLADDETQRADLEWFEAAEHYRHLCGETEALIALRDEAKQKLVELADGKKSRGGGVLVYPTKGRVTTDYKGALKEFAPGADLSGFEKRGKDGWAVRQEKE